MHLTQINESKNLLVHRTQKSVFVFIFTIANKIILEKNGKSLARSNFVFTREEPYFVLH